MATASFDREIKITAEDAIITLFNDLEKDDIKEIDPSKTIAASQKGSELLNQLFSH